MENIEELNTNRSQLKLITNQLHISQSAKADSLKLISIELFNKLTKENNEKRRPWYFGLSERWWWGLTEEEARQRITKNVTISVTETTAINDWHLPIGGHEDSLVNIFKRAASVSWYDTFIDVGAHVGTWSLKLASSYKKIFAFEPNKDAMKILQENIQLNNIQNITTINKAVYSKNCNLKFYARDAASHSSISETHPANSNVISTINVEAISLDNYFSNYNSGKIDLIKIDVEGAEIEVINGALKIIDKYKPSLCIETHSPENKDIVQSLLPDIHFDVYGDHLVFIAK